MPIIQIMVRDKVATTIGSPVIICGNSDYVVYFDLDTEWAPFQIKTARFNYTRDGVRLHQDILLTEDHCTAPVMDDVYAVEIGLYAGSIHTSTPARSPCERSATYDAPLHPAPAPDIYDQLLAYLSTIGTSDPFAIAANDIIAIAEEVA